MITTPLLLNTARS